MHADSIDPNYDFTGTPFSKMPYWVVKAAKHGAVTNHTIRAKIWCINCKRPMWTCDPKLEDTCEECSYILFSQLSELRQKRAVIENTAQVNPFAHGDDYIEPDGEVVYPILRR